MGEPDQAGRSRLRSRLTRRITDTSNHYQHLLLVLLVGTRPAARTTPLVGDGAPKALRSGLPGVVSDGTVMVAVVAAAIAVVVYGVGRWWLRRTLRARTVVRSLLPSPKFEPDLEEVERFAAVLSRAHRATRLPGTRRALGVRIRLSADDTGLVRYQLEGHHRARSVLTMAGYDQVDNVPADADGDVDQPGEQGSQS